jgi:hypothetical protein
MEDRHLQAAEMYCDLFVSAIHNLKDQDQQIDMLWKFTDSLPVGLFNAAARRLDAKKQELIDKYGAPNEDSTHSTNEVC